MTSKRYNIETTHFWPISYVPKRNIIENVDVHSNVNRVLIFELILYTHTYGRGYVCKKISIIGFKEEKCFKTFLTDVQVRVKDV